MKKCVLGDYILDMASGPFGSNLKVECFVSSGFPIIDGANLYGVRVTDNVTKFVTEEKARSLSRSIAKRHDVIVTISGTLGQVAYIPSDSLYEEYLCSQRQFRVTFDESKIDVEYLVNLLHTDYGQKKILSFANYVGVPALSQPLPNFRRIELELPDIEKQHEIANIISTIDRKIALNRKRIATLEAMAKEIYDYWFVQFDFPDAHGRPYKSSGGAMVYNPDLKREIPKGWEVKPLADAVKELNSGEWGSDACGESSSGQVHCLRGADMEDQSHLPVRYISERKADKLLNVGDIVIEMSGGSPTQATGRSCYVSQGLLDAYNGKLTCTNFCNSLKLKEPGETSYFLFVWRMFYRAGLMFNFEGKTSGLKNLQIDSLLATKWVFPPKELVTKFNKLFLSSTAQTDNCKKEISRLSDLRDFLLPVLMNGQVKVG